MSVKRRSLAEVRLAGLEILARELGPADYLRFVQQFEPGRGNYTAERQEWVEQLDGDTLLRMIEDRRKRRAEESAAGLSKPKRRRAKNA
jgi:hypothetical protein